MKMIVVPVLCALVCVSQAVQLEWTSSDYPNPMTDPELCGRMKESYICDPNGLLDKKSADALDYILLNFPNDTMCPCSTYSCEQGGTGRGYKLAVALLRRLKRPDGVEDTVEGRTGLAMNFAFNLLHKHWVWGTCDELTIVVFSKDDGILMTFPGRAAGRLLTETQTKNIQNELKRFFRYDHSIGQGLQYLSINYRRVLDGFGHYPVIYANVPSTAAIVSVSIVTSLISTLLLIWLC